MARIGGDRREAGGLRIVAPATYADLADSVRARLAMKSGTLALPKGSSGDSMNESTHATRWTGSASLQAALELLENGWDAGTKELRAITDAFAYASVIESGWENDVAGSRPCIPSYCAGVPDSMLRHQDVQNERPRVRIVAQCNFHCQISAERPRRYAAALALLVERLQADGHDVEVVTADVTNGQVWPFLVMPFGSPLDLSKVAFAVHPSFLRRVLFAVREQDAKCPVDLRSFVYGSPGTLKSSDLSVIFPDRQDDVVTVLLPFVQNFSALDAGDTMAGTLKALDVFRETVDRELKKAEARYA